MHLCVRVIEEGGDGEGVGSETLSDTLKYINLTGLVIGMVVLCGPIHLSSCVSEKSGDGEGAGSYVRRGGYGFGSTIRYT